MKIFFFVFFWSVLAVAFEFRLTSQQKFYLSDGRLAPGGTFSVLQASLIQGSTGDYRSERSLKVFSASGKKLFEHAAPEETFSNDEVEVLSSLYSNCKNPVETIVLKAGTFEACRIAGATMTSWFIDRFPFAVKQVIVDEMGLSVSEATEVLSGF